MGFASNYAPLEYRAKGARVKYKEQTELHRKMSSKNILLCLMNKLI